MSLENWILVNICGFSDKLGFIVSPMMHVLNLFVGRCVCESDIQKYYAMSIFIVSYILYILLTGYLYLSFILYCIYHSLVKYVVLRDITRL